MSSLIVEVCRVDEIEKHPNADKLSIVTVKGWNCIVGLDQYKQGDLVVFVPPDSIIPENIIEKYNLTYLKNGGRVGTTKLRGFISQGLILDLPEGKFKVGDDVSKVLGITKWEPPVSQNHQQANVISKKKLNPYFDRYTEIENIKNYKNVFEPGDMVVVTEKIHGCLQAQTMISLADGTKKTIRDIVENKIKVDVLSINDNGQIIPTKIINWYNNGNITEWYKVKFSRNKIGRGNHYGSIICTSNHKFYNPSDKKYIPCSDLVCGDLVLVKRNDIKLNFIQKQILIGKMLGDGSFGRNAISFGHKKDHEEYLDYTLDCLGSIAGNRQKDAISGYGTHMARGRTISSFVIKDYFQSWIENGTKIIPQNIELSPISLAFWYMDDGSLTHNEDQEDRISFATCNFDEKSIDNIIESLNKFGIIAKKKFTDNKYWRVTINADDADKLFVLIMPYVPYCMQYKLPERYRGNKSIKFNYINLEYKPNLVEQEIISVERINNLNKMNLHRYDIETETHNFIANDVIVHNSNWRAGNLPIVVDKTQPFIYRLKAKFKKLLGDTHQFVYGSHNVQLHGKNKSNNYYGEDLWGKVCAKYDMVNKIPKDYIVYGEVYGKGVQDLTYGLDDIDFMAFDVKYKGKYLGWNDLKTFCEEYDLPMVPVLYVGKFEEDTLEKYTSGKSMICPKQIREGCVIKDFHEKQHKRIGRKILKSISPDYLLRKNGTEFR